MTPLATAREIIGQAPMAQVTASVLASSDGTGHGECPARGCSCTHLVGVLDEVFARQQLAALVLHDGAQHFLPRPLVLPQLPRALAGLQPLPLVLALRPHQVQYLTILLSKRGNQLQSKNNPMRRAICDV